jgi:hypothetical protein
MRILIVEDHPDILANLTPVLHIPFGTASLL